MWILKYNIIVLKAEIRARSRVKKTEASSGDSTERIAKRFAEYEAPSYAKCISTCN